MASTPEFVTKYAWIREIPSKWHPGYFEHVIKEGARFHVISYSNLGRSCSEPKCEINAPRN